ncbi:tail fiber domain-containing protein [Hymenobacter baengnokdamensis]|uniref:tail fiber domain-containing protein n=1 Tax=Hymenobacter baengnokdamensis TaxID=2615203 RepID=UPI0017826286|nr:tail fiber domain-containing protein [Hymenobacter baengnokdamensis]
MKTLLLSTLLLAPVYAFAQSVGIGTTTPTASAALEIKSTSQGLLLPRLTLAQRTALTSSSTAPPVPGLVIYQTDNTPGLYAYDGATWVRLGADNLGNHTATQTLDLNSQRLLGNVGTSLGDSTAQVELNASVGTQSAALITRSTFGAKYTRAMLSGYGKLPDGTPTANDFGIWATAYRGGGWAGFFSAGSTTTPLRWVGICQNPGYNNTGSAIRIVDGTQGAGKVLTSDGSGYGKWQSLPPVTAAGGNFNLGPYYLVGNGGSTGIAISSAGAVGINTTTPYSQLANTATNIIGSDGAGGNPGSLTWAANQAGYASMFYNAGTAANSNGLAVKIAATGTAAALDVSQGITQDVAGAPLLRVLANGNVGIGVATPVTGAKLQVNGIALVGGGTVPTTVNATGLGWNAVNVNAGESEFYNYRGSGSGGFRFFSVGGTGTPTTSNNIAFINGSTGVYTTLSDRRVKTNIAPLDQGLRTVLALRPVSYDFHTSRRLQDGQVTFLPDDKPVRALGFVAQDLLQVVPEAVEKPADERREFYTVSYSTLVPVLTQAIQEQQAQIEELKKQNAALKAQAAADKAQATATLETFEARLRRLEAGTAQVQR